MLSTLRLLPNLVNPGYWKKLFGEISLVWKLMHDRQVPLYLKILPFAVAIYLLSPLDLIPGFLPVIGQLDDFGLLLVTLSTFIRLAPAEVVKQYLPANS